MTKKYNNSKITASNYGIDLSLLEINLKKTPTERIKNMNNISNGIKILQNAMRNNDK